MKTKHVLIIAALAFLAVSIFSGTQIWKAKRLATKVAVLETQYANSEIEKVKLALALKAKAADNVILIRAKEELEKQLAQERKDTDEKIREYKNTIADLLMIPADTVYQILFDRWNTVDWTDGALRFRFGEHQIRGMYLTVLERDHFESVFSSTTKALNTCTELNNQNNLIIGNLSDQNVNLKQQEILCVQQNSNLQEQLKVSDKQLNKVKRNSWMFKGAAVLGWAAFLLK
jgi:hypothetical protein